MSSRLFSNTFSTFVVWKLKDTSDQLQTSSNIFNIIASSSWVVNIEFDDLFMHSTVDTAEYNNLLSKVQKIKILREKMLNRVCVRIAELRGKNWMLKLKLLIVGKWEVVRWEVLIKRRSISSVCNDNEKLLLHKLKIEKLFFKVFFFSRRNASSSLIAVAVGKWKQVLSW